MNSRAGQKARKERGATMALDDDSLQITDRGRPRSDRAFLRRVVRAALEHGGVPQMPVSLLLTDDAEIGGIHGEFLGDRRPTDVISFALDGAAELVVSVETAARQARVHGHSTRAEVALYVVHGLLHLCGFDDKGARARARMRAAERAVLHTLGIEIGNVDG
ncbi:MAG: rRNA maturation RNase YbeY [Planctomycetota bacterium]